MEPHGWGVRGDGGFQEGRRAESRPETPSGDVWEFRVVIHTHHTRQSVLEETLGHLEGLGLHPQVSVQTSDPAPYRNKLNARDALAHARPWPPGGVLALEDDVRLAPDWADWIALAQAWNRPTLGYMSVPYCYPPRERQALEAGQPVEPGLYVMERARQFWGAQCIWYPTWFLQRIWGDPELHSEDEGGPPIDGYLAQAFDGLDRREKAMLAVPNFCQHESPPAVLKKRNGHKSFSFGAATTRPVKEVLREHHRRNGLLH